MFEIRYNNTAMSDVQFEEENAIRYKTRIANNTGSKSKTVQFLEKLGVPEEYVNYVLVGIFIASVFLSFLFFKSSASGTKTKISVPYGNTLIDTKNAPPKLEYPVE